MKKILIFVFVFCPTLTSYGMFYGVKKELTERQLTIEKLEKIVKELKDKLVLKDGAIVNLKEILNKITAENGELTVVNQKQAKELKKLIKTIIELEKKLNSKDLKLKDLEKELKRLEKVNNKLERKVEKNEDREEDKKLYRKLFFENQTPEKYQTPDMYQTPKKTTIVRTQKRRDSGAKNNQCLISVALISVLILFLYLFDRALDANDNNLWPAPRPV